MTIDLDRAGFLALPRAARTAHGTRQCLKCAFCIFIVPLCWLRKPPSDAPPKASGC
jgi:hypothetical protein